MKRLGYRIYGSGQATPLILVCAGVLSILGVGIIYIMLMMGGANEAQNAVDAGALQAARIALSEPKVELQQDEIVDFGGEAKQKDDKYFVDLSTINRIWGLALLQALNVQKMVDKDLSSKDAEKHARQIHESATAISGRLAQALVRDTDPNRPNPLQSEFLRLVNANSMRMIKFQMSSDSSNSGNQPAQGTIENRVSKSTERLKTNLNKLPGKSKDSADFTQLGISQKEPRKTANINVSDQSEAGAISTSSGSKQTVGRQQQSNDSTYAIAFTNRSRDSNIQFSVDQEKIGKLALNNLPPAEILNGRFFKGYLPVTVALSPPLKFMFVPLEHDQKPHLISASQFNQDKNADFSSDTLARSIPPNAFHFAKDVYVQNAKRNIQLQAFSMSKDMSPGFVMQHTRGFIRIENKDGLVDPTSRRPLHVLDLANRQIVKEYKRNLNLPDGPEDEAGLVLGRSLFNPVENREGVASPFANQSAEQMEIACSKLSGILETELCKDAPDYVSCCKGLHGIADVEPCDAPVYKEGTMVPWPNLGSPSMHPVYGFMPALTKPGSGREHYPASDGEIHRITPENEHEHKIFYDWLAGDYNADNDAWRTAFTSNPSMLPELMRANHGDKIATPSLRFSVDQFVSGMKDRMPQDAKRVSLLNGQDAAWFTKDGSLSSLLTARVGDPKLKPLYDLLVQRIREIAPKASIEELQGIFTSKKPIPMGAEAYIYLNDKGNLQLSVLPADTIPEWLQKVKDEEPDGAAMTFEYRETDANKDPCYRLVDPNADWDGELNSSAASRYPTRVCNFDIYQFFPSSGFHGLLGVFQLTSRLEKKCAKQGIVDPSSTWNQPQDCFCFPPNSERKNNANCGSCL
jgi:hypothetical protein